MGQLVDPDRLLAECGAMGVSVVAGEISAGAEAVTAAAAGLGCRRHDPSRSGAGCR